jgi:FkbM family methyltransferase
MSNPLWLNLGCGDYELACYRNLDSKKGDTIYPLADYKDGEADEVRASHVLEHFPHGQVADVVKEWARVLKPGAKLKIAVPDFDWIVKAYSNGHRGDARLEHYLFGGQVDSDDYHKTFFNEDKLKALLEGAGLVDVKKWESDADDCSSYHVSLNLEGRKPLPPRQCAHGVSREGAGTKHSTFPFGICECCRNSFAKTSATMTHCRKCEPAQAAQEPEPKLTYAPTPTYEFIKHSKGVIHVGANTGQARDIYAQAGLPVVWIEAISDVCRRLADNVARYPNQRALNYLIADKDDHPYMFKVASNDGQSSSIFDFGKHTEIWPDIAYTHTAYIKGYTLKTVLRQNAVKLDEYDTLILDTQGSELLVLKGAESILDKFNFIRAEACDFELYKGGCLLKDLDEYLIPRGFERVMTWHYKRSPQPEVERIFEALYQRKTAKRPQITPIYIHDEKSGAKAIYRVAALASVPRLGFQAHMRSSEQAFADPRIPILRESGCVFWEMTMQNGFNSLIKAGADYIITTDYDSIFTNEDVKELLRLIVRYPDADAIAAWQASRWKDHPALAGVRTQDGQWGAGVPIEDMKSLDLTRVDNTVYGLTIIKVSAIQKMSKPWFLNVPNEDGEWEHGKHDADSYFWWKFREAGNSLYMANRVRIGHLHEDVLWLDDDFQLIKQDLTDYYSKGRPF